MSDSAILKSYPVAALDDAIESRNRAWRDCVARNISQDELFAVLRAARERWGQEIYTRGVRHD